MPIPVACRCGKSFAANDNLAGKTVKCPSCQQPLRIPAPAAPDAAPKPAASGAADGKIVVACGCGGKFAAGAELAGKQVKCPKCGQVLTVGAGPAAAAPKPQPQGQRVAAAAPAAAHDDFGLGGLLDEVGVKQRASGENACPSCGDFLAPEALICVKCGYDRKTGKKLQVETIKKVETKKLGPPTAAAKAAAAKAAAAAGNPYASPTAPAKAYNADATLSVVDYLFIILCGWIALIVAIIYTVQGNPKGKPMLIAWLVVQAIAFGIGIILGVVGAVMQATSGG